MSVAARETVRCFSCMGGRFAVYVGGRAPDGRDPTVAALVAQAQLVALDRRLSRLNADPAPVVHAHLFWITSRAAGICALVLASLAVAAGLAIGSPRARGANLRSAHEALSLGALAAIVVAPPLVMLGVRLTPRAGDARVPSAPQHAPTNRVGALS